MAGKVIATFISIVTFVVIAGNVAFTQTDPRELERRISVVEKELKSLSTYVTRRAEVTLGYFQEAERTVGDSRSKISSLERRVSELGKQQEELRLRVERLEAKMLELERSGMVAKPVRTGSSLLARNNSSSRQIRRGTAVGELEWRVDRLEAKMLELGAGAKERRASIGLFAGKDSISQGAIRSASVRQTPRVIRADYRYYGGSSDPEGTIHAAPLEARPEAVRVQARRSVVEYTPQEEPVRRAVPTALALLCLWVAMLCAHTSR